MDSHVQAYYDYIDAMDWAICCEAQLNAEARWLDNGGVWNYNY